MPNSAPIPPQPPQPPRIPSTMTAVHLMGHGGVDKLVYRNDVVTPTPGPDEVLIKVMAAGVNNTDINTRTAWYSKAVVEQTNAGGTEGFEHANDADGSWSGSALNFPLIQGADCCGYIVAVGTLIPAERLGERVLVRNMLRSYVDYRPYECWTFGSECNGSFAQYTVAPARETYAVDCDWSDAQLASIPCAYSTAEGLLHRAHVQQGDRVLITGASGGVGSAAIQLAKRRGARVIAVAAAAKANDVLALGADQVIARGESLAQTLGQGSVDVVIDLVAGAAWPELLDILVRGGRYATAGAIGGPMVELDVRSLYLKDLTLFGCTFQEDIVFENLVGYIEAGEIRPVVAKTFALKDIVAAQETFLAKQFTGKLVLIPPHQVDVEQPL